MIMTFKGRLVATEFSVYSFSAKINLDKGGKYVVGGGVACDEGVGWF